MNGESGNKELAIRSVTWVPISSGVPLLAQQELTYYPGFLKKLLTTPFDPTRFDRIKFDYESMLDEPTVQHPLLPFYEIPLRVADGVASGQLKGDQATDEQKDKILLGLGEILKLVRASCLGKVKWSYPRLGYWDHNVINKTKLSLDPQLFEAQYTPVSTQVMLAWYEVHPALVYTQEPRASSMVVELRSSVKKLTPTEGISLIGLEIAEIPWLSDSRDGKPKLGRSQQILPTYLSSESTVVKVAAGSLKQLREAQAYLLNSLNIGFLYRELSQATDILDRIENE
jgi:hypothetical protein